MLPKLALALILSVLIAAPASEAKTMFPDDLLAHSPVGVAPALMYLEIHSDMVKVRAKLVEATARRDAAQLNETVEAQQFAKIAELHRRKAVSEEEYRSASLRFQISRLEPQFWKSSVEELTAVLERSQMLLKATVSKVLDLDGLYARYLEEWNGGCRRKAAEAGIAEAKLALANFRFAIAQKLYPSKAMSHAEYLDKKAKQTEATADTLAARQILADCDRDRPTLEWLKKQFQPAPEPLPPQPPAPPPRQ